MSYYAESSATGKRIYANEPYLFGRKDLVCPSCGCAMCYVSPVSNARAAHFRGAHLPDCDIGTASSKDVDPYNYSLAGNSVQGLLDRLLKDGVKNTVPGNNKTSSHESSTGTVHNSTIKTVRQLFNFCASVDPETCLPDGTKVKDIYCGLRTAHIYKDFVKGLHLMYAQYNGATADFSALFFCFPSYNEKRLTIAVYADSTELLRQIAAQFSKGDYGLIFASFDHQHCYVSSLTQIVPIKSNRKKNHIAYIR